MPIRIIFEKGVSIRRADNDTWLLQCTREGQTKTTLDLVRHKYGVRPVLLTQRLEPDYGLTINSLLSSTARQDTLNMDLSQLLQRAPTNNVSIFQHLINLHYNFGAVIYHCARLAQEYSDLCCHYARSFPDASEETIFGNQVSPFIEFDALVTSGRRTYDAMRYVIWRAFGIKGSTPNTFEKVIASCPQIPTSLGNRLNSSWTQYGSKLKEYRDCIQHYVPLTKRMAIAWMTRLENGVYATSILIPDNPEARSQAKFQYTSRLDALTYGWELANELLKLADAIVGEMPSS